MRLPHRLLLPALLCAALSAGTSCRTAGSAPGEAEAVDEPAILRVTNDSFDQLEIYIVRSGLPTRIGRVGASHAQDFPLRSVVLGSGDVSFYAVPQAGSGRATTGPLLVSAGQVVDFHVNVVLQQSTVSVH
jgi:hypothetical protein